jgi:hypothetical protein
MQVTTGVFSQPSKVGADNKMPGGGTERTATGKVEATIKKVENMTW